MIILKTILKAKFKKQPTMVVTFDEVYGFPSVLCQGVTKEQFNDAALMFMGTNLEIKKGRDVLNLNPHTLKRRKKKENSIRKFFRILFTKEKGVNV